MQSDDDKEWKDNFNKDNDNDVMMYNSYWAACPSATFLISCRTLKLHEMSSINQMLCPIVYIKASAQQHDICCVIY